MLQRITFITLVFLFFSQCTVEKRLHTKGYSVSWNKKFRSDKNDVAEKELAETDQESESEIDEEITDTIVADTEKGITDLKEDQLLADEFSADESFILDDQQSPLVDTVYVDTKFVPEGIAAISLLGGSMILMRLAAFITITSGYIFIAAFVLFIASFVLSIISIAVFSKYRSQYSSNFFGVTAFVLDLVGIFLFALFVILILTL